MSTSPSNPLACIDLSDVDVYAENPTVTTRYRAAVETMASQDAPVQYWSKSREGWVSLLDPDWTWCVNGTDALGSPRVGGSVYRIDPASRPKVMVPWSCPSDVPGALVWIRPKAAPGDERLVVGVNLTGVKTMTWVAGSFETILYQHTWAGLDNVEYSLDRLTWAPCTRAAS